MLKSKLLQNCKNSNGITHEMSLHVIMAFAEWLANGLQMATLSRVDFSRNL